VQDECRCSCGLDVVDIVVEGIKDKETGELADDFPSRLAYLVAGAIRKRTSVQ
jgi:hypothetical protein